MAAYVPRALHGTEEGEARLDRSLQVRARNQALVLDVCAVNDRFIPRFRSVLDESAQALFQATIDRMRFPRVFVPCPVEIALEMLRDEKIRGTIQRDAIEDLWNDYRVQRDQLRRRIVIIQDQFETPQRLRDLEARVIEATVRFSRGESWQGGLLSDHPADPLFAQSRKLAEQACRDLRALFTDSEFAAMPLSIRLALEWWK